ncbi:MAG: DUF3108 domain-containing protein [Parafilimonas sp.]
MRKILITLFSVVVWLKLSADDDFCGIRNTAFSANEILTYNVYYSVIGLFVNAGTATFTTTLEKLNNKPVYHAVGEGHTNSNYDWIFKVRDKYESYFDTVHLLPVKFVRNVDEGGYKKLENTTFDQQNNVANTLKGVYKTPSCIQDVLSAVYFARNINYGRYKVDDKIPFSMFLDNQVYNLYIRYAGKEVVKTRYGKFNAIKLKPLLLKGTIFEGGEKMTVWISDDANHIPLRIESPIAIGSIKVDMMGYRNLRYPLTSKISVR